MVIVALQQCVILKTGLVRPGKAQNESQDVVNIIVIGNIQGMNIQKPGENHQYQRAEQIPGFTGLELEKRPESCCQNSLSPGQTGDIPDPTRLNRGLKVVYYPTSKMNRQYNK
jgi:hypothetical protein